ncbi:TPA: hypothetical protein DEP96_02640 [Candidatus Uhrbacteria bacterium]|nr:hypothetical protein [Candidatus Uhrbacteria bacterium]
MPKQLELKEKIPTDLKKALAASPKIEALWEGLTPIARRDFVSWIEGAKQEETRKRRVVVACSKLAAGKRRPCCYSVVPLGLYTAINANPKAKATWSKLTSDERRDITDWLNGGGKTETQKSRIEQTYTKLTTNKNNL